MENKIGSKGERNGSIASKEAPGVTKDNDSSSCYQVRSHPQILVVLLTANLRDFYHFIFIILLDGNNLTVIFKWNIHQIL